MTEPSPLALLVHLVWLPLTLALFARAYRGPHPYASGLLAYFLGSFLVLPAYGLQLLRLALFDGALDGEFLSMSLWGVPVEEAAKVLGAVLAGTVLGHRPPSRSFLPMAVASSLGFAATESVLAVTEWGAAALPTRVLVAIPAHLAFTLMAGAGLVQSAGHPMSRWALAGWWLVACLAHSAYNVSVMYSSNVTLLHLMGVVLAICVLAGLLALVRWRLADKDRVF